MQTSPKETERGDVCGREGSEADRAGSEAESGLAVCASRRLESDMETRLKNGMWREVRPRDEGGYMRRCNAMLISILVGKASIVSL